MRAALSFMAGIRRQKSYWGVPRGEWAGETAFILGGGPSLAKVDVEALRGLGRVIAINDAGLTVAPWADVHYAADRVWFKWPHNQERLDNFRGTYRITRQHPPPLPKHYDIKLLGWDAGAALSRNPTRIAGRCGGSNSINVAYLFGSPHVILLGFDMRPGSWHGMHRRRIGEEVYRGEYIPAFQRMAAELTREGVRVINATEGSALRCFPIMPLQEAIMARAAKPAEAVEETGLGKRAMELLGAKRGATITEFGPFDPTASRELKRAGLKVTTVAPDGEGPGKSPGIEHVSAALDTLKKVPATDFGFSETLAERLPGPRIEFAARAMASRVRHGLYLRISTRDARGPRVTKRGTAWWLAKLSVGFRSVVLVSDDGAVAEIVCRND